MKTKNLTEIRTTLHNLWSNLPAIKARSSEEVVRRHMQLIQYYQRQYDLLVLQQKPA